ncbi:MAG TPA: hypothetical protein VHU60_05530 [Gaiellaceae bacterium]|nr:hypothetical protein [Gaiellaceae bacterium]
MRGVTGEELLRRPVRLRGIQLGRPVDVLLHPREPHALGLDVLCGDERHRFLPASAAKVHSDQVEVTSPLVLLDLREDSFYRLRTRSLSALLGTRVGDEGELEDIVLGPGWRIVELVLEGGDRVPLDGLALPGGRSR